MGRSLVLHLDPLETAFWGGPRGRGRPFTRLADGTTGGSSEALGSAQERRGGREVAFCYHLDVVSTHRDESATQLEFNDLGRICLRSTTPLINDPYRRNRSTGGFVLIDEATNSTVAAGMLLEPRA